MFGNSRWQSQGGKKEVNYREEEKKILDSVLGPKVYDKRIRPSGINSTGKLFFLKNAQEPIVELKVEKLLFFLYDLQLRQHKSAK